VHRFSWWNHLSSSVPANHYRRTVHCYTRREPDPAKQCIYNAGFKLQSCQPELSCLTALTSRQSGTNLGRQLHTKLGSTSRGRAIGLAWKQGHLKRAYVTILGAISHKLTSLGGAGEHAAYSVTCTNRIILILVRQKDIPSYQSYIRSSFLHEWHPQANNSVFRRLHGVPHLESWAGWNLIYFIAHFKHGSNVKWCLYGQLNQGSLVLNPVLHLLSHHSGSRF